MNHEEKQQFIQQVLANQIFDKFKAGEVEKKGVFSLSGEYVIREDGNLYMGNFTTDYIKSKKDDKSN